MALGNLELAARLAGNAPITPGIIETAAQSRLPGYDKKGEYHYNVISAFIKSYARAVIRMRHLATGHLARMIQAGEDPKFIARRMVIFGI